MEKNLVSEKCCDILITLGTIRNLRLMKRMKHTGQCDSELAWYSTSITRRIRLGGLDRGLRILGVSRIWHCLIIVVLEIRAKFLEPFGYWTVIKCTFTVLPWGFQITDGLKQCIRCQRTLYLEITKYTEYLPQVELIESSYVLDTN